MIADAQDYCLIIGTQRGGTSTLFETLSKCSGIAGSFTKELHYFDNPESFIPSLATYSNNFRGVGVRMEASPSYLYIPIVAKRIKEMLPQARFIVLLRNPVDRAFSHFAFVQRQRSYTDIQRSLAFEEALKLEDKEIVITINGFEIKGLGNTRERVLEKFNIPIKVQFIRSYSRPPIMFDGHHPPQDIKDEIIKILGEEVEFGLLVDEY